MCVCVCVCVCGCVYVYMYICISSRQKKNNLVLCDTLSLKDLSIQPLNFVQLLGHEFNSHSEPTLYRYSNLFFC